MRRPRSLPPPPRVAGSILRAALPRRDRAAWVGDLNEEYARFALPERGALRARGWYWRQVLGSLPRAIRHRLGGAPPPIGPPARTRQRPLSALRDDLRSAWRTLRGQPATTLGATLTLALGIGANVAMFTLVNAVVLRPLPYDDPEALVRFWPEALFYFGLGDMAMLDQQAAHLYRASAYGRTLETFTGGAGPEVVRGARVSPHHFDVLGVQVLHGRSFMAGEGEPGREPVAILAYGFWQGRFGGDEAIVGSSVEVGGAPLRVIGVMPREHVPIESDWQFWKPLDLDPERDHRSPLAAVARLHPGVSAARAGAETRELILAFWRSHGSQVEAADVVGLVAQPIARWVFGDWRPRLLMIQGTVIFVLVIAAANVANLLLASGSRRSRELALRAALGAGRGRIVRLLFAEATLLSVLGATAGLLLASLLVSGGAAAVSSHVPRATELSIDATVLAYTVLAAIAAAIAFGSAPALRAAPTDIGRLIAGGGRGASAGRGEMRLNEAFVALQVALGVILVTGAGLMLRSFWTLQSVDPGFRPLGVVTVRPAPPSRRYPTRADYTAYHRDAIAALEALPGVRAVGGIMFLPMRPGGYTSLFRDAEADADWTTRERTSLRIVTPGYFRAMEVPLVAGRSLRPEDTADGPAVMLVNESLARSAWPGEDPVGRRLVLDGGPAIAVVGVVADVRQAELALPGGPEGYLPYAQQPWRNLYLTARVDGDARDHLGSVRSALRALDPAVPLNDLAAMTDVVGATTSRTRILTTLIATFGALALVLGMIGIYGVTSYSVARARREIGVRMAVGARAHTIVREIVVRGGRPVMIGVLVGLAGAAALSRLLEGMLFEVSALDPMTFTAVPLVLVTTAAAALVIPARAAARTDPVRVLATD